MILFVVCQVAGAEYLYPLVRQDLGVPWEILASPICAEYLGGHSIPHRVLESVTLEEARVILDELKPTKALIGASRGSTLESNFLIALKEHGIPVMQFLDVWTNYGARFQTMNEQAETGPLLPDRILAIDEAALMGLIAAGIPAEKILIVGQPYFEMLTESYRNRGRLVEHRKTLLSTQPIARFYGRELGYDEIDFVQCCCEAWQLAGESWADLELSLHPTEQIETYAQLQERFGLSIHIGVGDPFGYRRVLSMFSTMLVKGILAGCQVASVQPGAVGIDRCLLPERIPRFHDSEALAGWLSQTRANSYHEGLLPDLAGSRARIVSLLQGGGIS